MVYDITVSLVRRHSLIFNHDERSRSRTVDRDFMKKGLVRVSTGRR